MTDTITRCKMYVHIIAQKFVNKARSGKYALISLAEEYDSLIWFCRVNYGFCPNDTARLYDRLPEALQNEICKQWEEGLTS